MDSINAMLMGEANRDKEPMVFDWVKAAKLLIKHKAVEADAGLAGDWNWTAGTILRDGMPVRDSYAYLASTWAKPQLEIDGTRYNCYVMKSERPDWNAGTCWPEEALQVFAPSEYAQKLLSGK